MDWFSCTTNVPVTSKIQTPLYSKQRTKSVPTNCNLYKITSESRLISKLQSRQLSNFDNLLPSDNLKVIILLFSWFCLILGWFWMCPEQNLLIQSPPNHTPNSSNLRIEGVACKSTSFNMDNLPTKDEMPQMCPLFGVSTVHAVVIYNLTDPRWPPSVAIHIKCGRLRQILYFESILSTVASKLHLSCALNTVAG